MDPLCGFLLYQVEESLHVVVALNRQRADLLQGLIDFAERGLVVLRMVGAFAILAGPVVQAAQTALLVVYKSDSFRLLLSIAEQGKIISTGIQAQALLPHRRFELADVRGLEDRGGGREELGPGHLNNNRNFNNL